jgi:hypothetical protein
MFPEKEELVNRWRNQLLQDRGYFEEDLVVGLRKGITVNDEKFEMYAELAIRIDSMNFMLFKFERPARPLTPLERRTVSIAKIIDEKPFPYALLTNGLNCLFIDIFSGNSTENCDIPSRSEAIKLLSKIKAFKSDIDIEKEMRIFAAIDSIKCEICEE